MENTLRDGRGRSPGSRITQFRTGPDPRRHVRRRAENKPDPRVVGRLFRKKEDQNTFLAETERDDESEYCPKSRWRYEWEQMRREKRLASSNAKGLVECAKWRREERVALANARRRARELKAAAEANAAAEAKSDKAKGKKAAPKVKNQESAGIAEEKLKIHGKWIVVKGPSGSPENKWVPDTNS